LLENGGDSKVEVRLGRHAQHLSNDRHSCILCEAFDQELGRGSRHELSVNLATALAMAGKHERPVR